MQAKLNIPRLFELLMYLQEITTLRFSLHDLQGNEIFASKNRSDFCDLICNSPDGYERCFNCDYHAIQTCKKEKKPWLYRCHSGLVETAIPVMEDNEPTVIILLGQFLDTSPIEEQWEKTQQLCTWHKNAEELKRAFFHLPRFSPYAIRAAYEIIYACVSDVRYAGMIETDEMTEAQRLQTYIRINYAESLSLSKLCKDMTVSKNKLYQLANEIEPDITIVQLITKRRMEVAEKLLRNTNKPISEIASSIGISDYNYFTKVFKKYYGMTPSLYRQTNLE